MRFQSTKTQASRIGALSVAFLSVSSTACSAEKSLIAIRTASDLVPPATSTPVAVPPDSPAASTADAKPTERDNLSSSCSKPAQPAKQILNVPYQNVGGVNPNFHSLDIYMPAVADPCQGVPIVIWVHGGAWMVGDKANGDSQVKAKHINSMGYGFIIVNYRLSPDLRTDPQLNPVRIKFPDHPNDVGAAVAWVHKNISGQGGDPIKGSLCVERSREEKCEGENRASTSCRRPDGGEEHGVRPSRRANGREMGRGPRRRAPSACGSRNRRCDGGDARAKSCSRVAVPSTPVRRASSPQRSIVSL